MMSFGCSGVELSRLVFRSVAGRVNCPFLLILQYSRVQPVQSQHSYGTVSSKAFSDGEFSTLLLCQFVVYIPSFTYALPRSYKRLTHTHTSKGSFTFVKAYQQVLHTCTAAQLTLYPQLEAETHHQSLGCCCSCCIFFYLHQHSPQRVKIAS